MVPTSSTRTAGWGDSAKALSNKLDLYLRTCFKYRCTAGMPPFSGRVLSCLAVWKASVRLFGGLNSTGIIVLFKRKYLTFLHFNILMIVCAGSIAFDTTNTPFRRVERALGGSASYFGVSASFFTKTSLVSAVGEDFPQPEWNALSKHCDLQAVEKLKGKTFFFESTFDFDMQNRTLNKLDRGVFEKHSWAVPQSLKTPDFLFLNTHEPAFNQKVFGQVEAKMVFTDVIEYLTKTQKPFLQKFLKKTGGFILNDAEARILTGETNLIKAGKKIRLMGPEIVVVKKGEHGGLLFYDGEVFPFPAFPLEDAVDPTGAGDAFAGGFVGWLDKQKNINEKTLREACYYGTVMASFCVEAFGLDNLFSLNQAKIKVRLQEYERLSGLHP